MTKYLRKETRDRIKKNLKPVKGGWLLGIEGAVPRFLTDDEVKLIHDLCVFQSTQEYVEWVREELGSS